jgi:WhiB family redox-sensing transcriptional regulator
MYTLNEQIDITSFDEIVEPIAVRVAKPRCADGNGTLTHLFFSDNALDTARAKAICGKCTLADDCLAGALDRAEPWGVWGGELVENGRVVAVKRPRGRPPKNPRPVMVIEEVPIPPHLLADRPRSERVA